MGDKSESNISGGAKPPNLQSRLKGLQNMVTNHEIFIDHWVEACQDEDDDARARKMKALAEMWSSLGQP